MNGLNISRITHHTCLRSPNLLVWCALIIGLTFCLPNSVLAEERCPAWAGKIVSAEGVVEARRVAHTTWEPTKVGETFCPGDKLRVETWRAAIVLANETIIRLDQGTTITFTEIENKETSWLELLEGIVHFISRVPQNLTITTPFVNATVEGTEFVIRVDATKANVWVLEGSVRVENPMGKLLLEGGEAAVTRAGEGPKRRLDIKPRDAVQWALYYPPLLDINKGTLTGPNQDILGDALTHYQAGDIRMALDKLNAIPLEQRDPKFLGIRAGLLLSVGQIDKAKIDIEEALRHEPNNGTALALQSVVALVNNQKDDALQLANRSVASSPQSSIGHMALSYARQASFNIEQALASAQQATNLSPEDALAWARVAELQLSLGDIDEAREAAQQAVELNPRLARTQTILGFALLAEAKIGDARTNFERAIALDQADPLPRLGLGLTKIQRSALAEGRRDIEIAASLDPSNSIIRSYLGKAYYEEKWDTEPRHNLTLSDFHNDTKQNRLAASQYQMAKELDPQDPTPYFYDALRKQTTNRPVEALEDFQKSIELNDNRVVYRSKLLLDEDQAARSSSLGRIYQDLGFQQRALVEGWDAVSAVPNEHAAHRLLADSYASRPRFNVARASELLQSQLFQQVNFNNLQPQLSETNLQILEGAGPGSFSFNEFNPIFMRDRFAVLGNLLVGSQNTFAEDVVVSAMLADPVSLSIGQFHYETDGYRTNNDLTQDILNVFLQGEITPKISLQGEYRWRETQSGDLRQNFDPNMFQTKLREDEEQNTARVGGRFSPTVNTDILVSLIYAKQDATVDNPEAFFDAAGSPVSIKTEGESKSYQGESQAIFRHRLFNTIVGGGAYKFKTFNGKTSIGPINITAPSPPFPPGFTILLPADTIPIDDTKDHHENGYIYINSNFIQNVRLTGGLSFDHVDSELNDFDRDQLSPKAGLQWDMWTWLRLRLAYIQNMSRLGAVKQTIEPTQVAGFNQIFDDPNSSRATLYGGALDAKLSHTLFSGVEVIYREFRIRGFNQSMAGTITPVSEKFRESNYRGYLIWAPCQTLSVTSEIEWTTLYRPGGLSSNDGNPSKVETITGPITARYFHPSGVFAGLGGTFVHQTIDPSINSTFSKDDDTYFLVDASAGYRFPQRLGIFMIQVLNLFDKDFLYQDSNTLINEAAQPPFAPDRTILAKLTIALN